MSASFRSTRRTVASVPGEPKLVDRRAAGRESSPEGPTLAPSGSSGKEGSLGIHPVYPQPLDPEEGASGHVSTTTEPVGRIRHMARRVNLTTCLVMLYFIVFVVILAAAVAVFLTQAGPQAAKPSKEFQVRYIRREVMSPTEVKFFARLSAAAPHLLVAPQVALSALVDIADHQKRGKYQHTNRAKIAQQRLDFVLMSKETGKVVCVVELDDHTHDNERQRAKDLERDAILTGTGYKVLRFDARKMPQTSELAKTLGV